ncbi:HAMP domain-containing protein [Agrobacterium tumefaciens]|nr:HAMP domain-containing protein [Agrobacterium tumefaciens]
MQQINKTSLGSQPSPISESNSFCDKAAAAYWLARYFITPVEQLRYGLRAIANGQLDVRIAHTIGSKRDEVASLAHDLDITAARLQELQIAQQQLFRDVSHENAHPCQDYRRLSASCNKTRRS